MKHHTNCTKGDCPTARKQGAVRKGKEEGVLPQPQEPACPVKETLSDLQSRFREVEAVLQDLAQAPSREAEAISQMMATVDLLDEFSAARQLERDSDEVRRHLRPDTRLLLIVRRNLLRTLQSLDVSPVEAEGMPVDYACHDVLGTVPSEDSDAHEHVAEVLCRGYRRGERVLRPAKVTVFKYTNSTQKERRKNHAQKEAQ